MNFKLFEYKLTDEHPASHYGIPVLVDVDGQAYGPADQVGPIFGTGAHVVIFHLTTHNQMPKAEREAIQLYLEQDPTGPQARY